MLIQQEEERVPVVVGRDGVARVAGTRVTLDTVLAAFDAGATAEEIVQQYPALQLSDVYRIIGYYLYNHRRVEAYLKKSADRSEKARRANQARFDPQGIRRRLLARSRRKAGELVGSDLFGHRGHFASGRVCRSRRAVRKDNLPSAAIVSEAKGRV